MKNMIRILGLCKQEASTEELVKWASTPWEFFAMGNYPYASAYIPTTAGVSTNPLPPNPLNRACAILTRSSDDGEADKLASLRASVQFWYNTTGAERCFTILSDAVPQETCHGDYSFQRCAELAGPYQQGTRKDAFWPPLTVGESAFAQLCRERYGRDARTGAVAVEFGGNVRDTIAGMSNIIWSNGEFDPWSGYGVDCSRVDCPESVFSPYIKGGAQSSDLMFTDPMDTKELVEVRRMEYAQISSWIEARIIRYAGVKPQGPRSVVPKVNVVVAQ
jgi:lysosomal Pro-X carboxypeptidase